MTVKDGLHPPGRPEEGRAFPNGLEHPPGRPVHQTPSDMACELCGGPLLERHCKVMCLNCGYQRDCSDP